MSGKKDRDIRRISKLQARQVKDITIRVVEKLIGLPFKQRVKWAWRILRAKKPKARKV